VPAPGPFRDSFITGGIFSAGRNAGESAALSCAAALLLRVTRDMTGHLEKQTARSMSAHAAPRAELETLRRPRSLIS